jgi:hypothetical protein
LLLNTKLGRPAAVKKILSDHIESLPSTSVWAYLAYLDSCMQIGDREAFESMRSQYQVQFNFAAPQWLEMDSAKQTLEFYPHSISEITAAWNAPELARNAIAACLLDPLRQPLQLPAYDDLLDLYDLLDGVECAPGSTEAHKNVNVLNF